MKLSNCLYLLAILAALLSTDAHGQSQPSSLVGCLDANGSLYSIRPKGQIAEECSGADLQIELGPGTIDGISAGNGLAGGGDAGTIDIAVDSNLAIPPSCPPGQIPLSDDAGGWTCTPSNLLTNPNSAATVWVVPKLDSYRFDYEFATFVNPGTNTAQVICHFFTGLGVYLFNVENNIPSGGIRRCVGQRGGEFDRVWMVAVSDVPILPTVELPGNFSSTRHHAMGGVQIEAYAIDCRYPEGYESVCELAID